MITTVKALIANQKKEGHDNMNDKTTVSVDKFNLIAPEYPTEPILRKIVGRYFEVTTRFDDKDVESVLHQFIELLKQENII